MSTPDLNITINQHGYADKIFSQQPWAVYMQGVDESDADTVDGIERIINSEANGRVTLQHFEVRWTDETGLACTNEYGRREAVRLSSIESVVVTTLIVSVRTSRGEVKTQDVPAVLVHLASGRTVVQLFLGEHGWDAAYCMFDGIETLVGAD